MTYEDASQLLREIGNGQRFILNSVFLGILVSFLLRRIADNKSSWGTMFTWRHRDLETQSAVAMCVYFLSEFVRTTTIWVGLILSNYHDVPEHYSISGLMVGVVLGITGLLCLIRVFSREVWGHWVWIMTGVVAVIVPILVHYILD